MLNQETKRKIDNARDILVGKVPDPKAQVEQITTALIYKFMDDMDKESIEVGGKARFFSGEYEKYAWSKLLDTKLGGQDRANLYVEALSKFSQNQNIPEIFRKIFKDAFLPYRDSETLNLFLKEVNGFSYDHSEDLGDAYEYLLSVLGSQGDAGQFRTPRHIIDFIVEVLDPQKTDTILDPACGTAGFLISAYKHILKQHDGLDENGKPNKEKILTPDERKQLINNFTGYDISPDMVRISLVNMYLHGFQDPKIFEYDTLTSEDKWEEHFDVILANPPFMTPKGGIRPHKRFSVQASRSEVLFVNYIVEHLKQNGRAGIIVPEGVIFQSGNAYKQLRKQLLDNGLFAVISLPAGVFQPYSGVKTSILMIDKGFENKKKEVLFVSVSNTGISLGATNTPIKDNDLPYALEDIRNFKNNINTYKASWSTEKYTIQNNDFSLTGLQYKLSSNKESPIQTICLRDICKVYKGKSSSTKTQNGPYKLYLTAEDTKGSDHFDFEGDGVAVPIISALGHGKAAVKRIHRVKGKFALANLLAYIEPDQKVLLPDYLYIILDAQKTELAKLMKGAANVSMKVEDLESFKITLPDKAIQETIVSQIMSYRKIVDLATEMLKVADVNIVIDPLWPTKKIHEIASIRYGYTATAQDHGDVRYIRITDITEFGELANSNYMFANLDDESKKYLLRKGDVLVARTGATYGKTMIFSEEYPAVFASYLMRLQFDESLILPEFYWCFSQTKYYWDQAKKLVTGGAQPQFNGNVLKDIVVPLPPLEKQRSITLEFMKLRNLLINQNIDLIDIFTRKIKDMLDTI